MCSPGAERAEARGWGRQELVPGSQRGLGEAEFNFPGWWPPSTTGNTLPWWGHAEAWVSRGCPEQQLSTLPPPSQGIAPCQSATIDHGGPLGSSCPCSVASSRDTGG